MIRHQRQLAEHRRALSKLKAVRLRTKNLLTDMRLEDLGLLRPMDQRVEMISKEISDYSERRREFVVTTEFVELMRDLPRFLIFARQALGWTQEELGRRTGYSRKQIGVFERSNYESIPLKAAISIAKAISRESQVQSKRESEKMK